MEEGKQWWVLTYCHLAFIGGWSSSYVGNHFHMWAVIFVCGQLSRRSFPFVSCCLCTWVVRGCTDADGRGCGGYGACACVRGGAGCRCGRGCVLVVWHKEEGGGECNNSPAYADSDHGKHRHHLDNMACCHVIAFHCGWRPQLSLWVASDGGGWWV